MAPHCDSLDGPVVKAAKRALETHNVDFVLPYVAPEAEQEVKDEFDQVAAVRFKSGALAQQVADRYFYNTVVRLHRAAEGAPFTGLKPAGADTSPVVPLAEQAIEEGSPFELLDQLTDVLRSEVEK